LERTGTLEAIETAAEHDLLARAFRDRLQRLGIAATGGVLRVESAIPIARGLGSSAAAIVAGLALADEAAGRPFDPPAALADALAHEPHPDNLGAALLGGLVAAVPARPGSSRGAAAPGAAFVSEREAAISDRDAPIQPGAAATRALRLFRLPLSPDVGFAFAAPAATLATAAARAALPAAVPHALAARSAARAIALVRGLQQADPALLAIAFDDELHVPHRLPLIHGASAARNAALDAGAWAVTISGAGSGLIAVCEPDRAAAVASAMRVAFDAAAGAASRAAGDLSSAAGAASRAAGHLAGGAAGEAIGFVARPDLEGVRVTGSRHRVAGGPARSTPAERGSA